MGITLAIETSCDETSAAIVKDGFEVLANVVDTQIEMHAGYGGVVPEVASRAHLLKVQPVIEQALSYAQVTEQDIDLVSATYGPGLIGALLVGVSCAKSLALAWEKPFVGVNHVEGHLFACLLDHQIEPPFIVLLVAGGHTQIVQVEELGNYKVLGSTIDDAAGEAYDKVARYMGLGYPGGPIIDRLAHDGDPEAIKFPRGLNDDSYNFSFSGLKTAVINYVRKHPETKDADLAASFQEAVVDVLVNKTVAAAKGAGINKISIGGGVSANSRLRAKLAQTCEQQNISCYLPSLAYCTDNAAMIASAAAWKFNKYGPTALDAGAYPTLKLEYPN